MAIRDKTCAVCKEVPAEADKRRQRCNECGELVCQNCYSSETVDDPKAKGRDRYYIECRSCNPRKFKSKAQKERREQLNANALAKRQSPSYQKTLKSPKIPKRLLAENRPAPVAAKRASRPQVIEMPPMETISTAERRAVELARSLAETQVYRLECWWSSEGELNGVSVSERAEALGVPIEVITCVKTHLGELQAIIRPPAEKAGEE